MEIKVPFMPEFLPKILEGRKTCTSRNKRYGKPGDYFVVDGRRFEILRVEKRPLAEVYNDLWKQEGVEDQFEFVDIWNRLHRRKKYEDDPFHIVFVHHFREMNA